MKHLNSNVLCVVAIKTTGPDAQKHELLEVAIIPLTATCSINKTIIPFNVLFRPNKIERAKFNLDNDLVLKCVEQGMDSYDAADIFERWFVKLGLRQGKKIMVLAHNWAAKRDFIKEWLEPTSFEMTFHHEYRDPQAIGLYLNDCADVRNERYPFAKVKLSYMAAVQKIEYTERLPTVIDECQCLIDLYQSIIKSV